MNEHHRVRDGLRGLREPTIPVPPPDLADTVLTRLGRRRRAMRAGIAALVLILVAAVPLALARQNSEGAPPAGPPTSQTPDLPRPGGGPSAIWVYGVGDETFVLNPATGSYQHFPFEVTLSPDLQWAAVVRDGKAGVAPRDALLRDGEGALTWVDSPPAYGPAWSPDGRKLLLTAIDFATAVRYELDSGTPTMVPLPDIVLGAPVAWAGDSENYIVATLKNGLPSATQHLNGDGYLTEGVDGAPGRVMGYSPGQRYGFMQGFQKSSTVFYVKNGALASAPPYIRGYAGWYDESTVALVDESGPDLLLYDAAGREVGARIPLPGMPDRIQIGSSRDLTGEAVAYGF